jgi:ATP-dependent RNA helicase RhlE
MDFSNFGLEAEILAAVRQAGYLRPTPVQAAAIPKVMQGGDLIAIAQTGTGKTAAFVLPMLQRLSLAQREGRLRGVRALILVPTRELALQIVENIGAYGRHLPIRVAAIFGGVEEEAQVKSLRGGVHVIVATPGRLMDLMEQRKLDFSGLEVLVLDEADRMLHMGFLRDIETIIDQVPKRRQTLMFSATFPREVESLAKRFLHRAEMVRIGRAANPAETVSQSVYEVATHLKAPLLIELLKHPRFERVLVFTRMKDGADRLTQTLLGAGVKVAKLHSSRSQEQRLKALDAFKEGGVRVLVATDIVARGIDIHGVTHVVNYDFPVNPDDYIHRIGRTGRAEAQGEALSFVPQQDLNLLHILEMAIGQRLVRKRLRGFNYQAPVPPRDPTEEPARRDWRKRTREIEAKKAAVKTPTFAPVRKSKFEKSAGKGGKPSPSRNSPPGPHA